ncbi:hypothetical protein PoB_007106100 [Plakobranchus ocellatus]|uniref:Uncharacterized protein n=1 Tax=Plakobranchus ocellatus TaxID=259542 RepID=A0AAV4DK39_9GAST|nr:hypothetical protein PoB_007106100 [Plakobranchus ocellatus]
MFGISLTCLVQKYTKPAATSIYPGGGVGAILQPGGGIGAILQPGGGVGAILQPGGTTVTRLDKGKAHYVTKCGRDNFRRRAPTLTLLTVAYHASHGRQSIVTATHSPSRQLPQVSIAPV